MLGFWFRVMQTDKKGRHTTRVPEGQGVDKVSSRGMDDLGIASLVGQRANECRQGRG